MTLTEQIEQMYDYELTLGGRAAKQYGLLDSVMRKDLPIEGFPSYLLYNPGRKHSVMADVSPEVLAHRQCFLCPEGVEDKQQALAWENYVIRVNPFPIFRHHFTISSAQHEPQRIKGHYLDMLHLAEQLPTYSIFYNGPRCGASAPDHMHFQAVPMNSLPLQTWCDEHISGNRSNDEVLIERIPVFCPSSFLIESKQEDGMERALFSLIDLFCNDFNIVSWKHNGQFRSIIYFRSKSRPDCFFAEDEREQILFSPATVEMSGVGIVSSEDSFHKIDADRLHQMICEVSYPC